jgi:hypothetical protein
MKAKMTVYQEGGKMPADSKRQELARKLFGTIPKFNKEEARYGMMAEKIKELQKEYDYWTDKKQPTTASGVKVQMDKIREDMKKYAGGGKMDMYLNGGKVGNKVKRLENREANLVARGSKAVDEGRERKADRLLGKAARVENRVIKAKESASVKKMAGGGKMDMMYGMGGKMKKYLAGGQVELDKNKDGKITGVDFKMLKKK